MKGALAIALLCIISIILWLLAKLSPASYPVPTLLLLSQLSGVLAATLLSAEFILASRLKILDRIFGGLDKVYRFHHTVGGYAFIVALAHPALLIANAYPYADLALNYIAPIGPWSYKFGVLAMYTLIALLFITYYLKLPYHLWKASHILLGIPLLFATIHVILIPSDTTLYLPLKIWLMSLLTFAGLAYVYRRFLYSFIGPRYNYKVAYTVDRGMVLDIYLKPDGKRKLSHNPGQFIYVSFKNPALAKEKHPYTISSEPSSDYLRISVKSLGDYTSTLKNLKVDDGATVFGPYGSFGEKSIVQKKPQIWIAGGIGITPFLSLLQHHIKNNSAAAITMFYCTKNQQEAVYLQDMMQLVSTSSNIKIVPFYSELQSYLNVEKIGQVVSAFRDSNIFLCGPAPMMHGLADQLNKAGVNSRNIVFEDFNYK